jgi:hypothetical protein
VTDDVGRTFPSVRQRDVDPCCPIDDVAVGENQAVVRKDKARAGAPVVAGAGAGAGMTDADADDGRGNRVDHACNSAGVFIEEVVVGVDRRKRNHVGKTRRPGAPIRGLTPV